MRTTNLRRPALGAMLLLALATGGALRAPLGLDATGATRDAAIAGWDFRFDWNQPRFDPRGAHDRRDRHEHDACVTEFDEGWDKGAIMALREAYRDGNRGAPYCDHVETCEPGRSFEWMRGYRAGYAAAYRNAYEFGRDARRRGLGKRDG